MQNTTLQRRTPLRAKSSLKSKTYLHAYVGLSVKAPIKCRQKSARKLVAPYHSIFSDDMHRCIITGAEDGVDPHHIFPGSRKALSEKYGFMLPLRRDWHEGTNYSIHSDRELDLKYKRKCQDYYTEVLNKSKEDWISEFGKWW